MDRTDWISGIILTIAVIGQITLAVLLYDPGRNADVINAGWLLMLVSGILGWLPIFTFRRHGNVEGNNYMRTTRLVDRGVYAVIRHPQYLAGVLMAAAIPLITWHWSILILGAVVAAMSILAAYSEEKQLMDKFGEEYQAYRERVPRMNFFLGIFRLIRRWFKDED